MEGAVNILGAVTAFVCSLLLYRGYRRTGASLLFWGSVCFLALGIENSVLFVDRYMTPDDVKLSVFRYMTAVVGLGCLIRSLISES